MIQKIYYANTTYHMLNKKFYALLNHSKPRLFSNTLVIFIQIKRKVYKQKHISSATKEHTSASVENIFQKEKKPLSFVAAYQST